MMSDANDKVYNSEVFRNKTLEGKSQNIELQPQTLSLKTETLDPVQEQPNSFVQRMMREHVTSVSHRRAAFPMLYKYMKEMSMNIDPEVALSVQASIKAETVSTPTSNQNINVETVSSPPASNQSINAKTVSTPLASNRHINAETVSTPSASNQHINDETVSTPAFIQLDTENVSTPALSRAKSVSTLASRQGFIKNVTSDMNYDHTAYCIESKIKSKYHESNSNNINLAISRSQKVFERNAPIKLHRKEKLDLLRDLRTDNLVYGFPDFRETENFQKACSEQSNENDNEQESERTNCSDVWISLREASKNNDRENGNYVPAGAIMGPYLQAFAKKTRHMPY